MLHYYVWDMHYQVHIKDLMTLESTETLLIPLESSKLLRNFANPYLFLKTHGIRVYVKTNLYIWESIFKILISL